MPSVFCLPYLSYRIRKEITMKIHQFLSHFIVELTCHFCKGSMKERVGHPRVDSVGLGKYSCGWAGALQQSPFGEGEHE